MWGQREDREIEVVRMGRGKGGGQGREEGYKQVAWRAPLALAMESISSKKRMQGAAERALSNSSLGTRKHTT